MFDYSELPKLIDPDTIGTSTEELRVQAEAELRAYRGPAQRPNQQECTDATGSVRVTVGNDGQVRNVEFRDDWQSRLDASQLGDALFEAYQAALVADLTAMAIEALAGKPRHNSPPDTSVQDSGYARLGPYTGEHSDPAQTFENAQLLLLEMKRNEAAARERSSRVVETHGPFRLFAIRLRGTEIEGITGDERRISAASVGRLRHDALIAFQAAKQQRKER